MFKYNTRCITVIGVNSVGDLGAKLPPLINISNICLSLFNIIMVGPSLKISNDIIDYFLAATGKNEQLSIIKNGTQCIFVSVYLPERLSSMSVSVASRTNRPRWA